MKLSYRDRVKLLGGAGLGIGLKASGLASLAGWAGASLAQGDAGGTLRWALTPEPPTLVTAFNSSQMVQQISAKMMDGLVAYDRKLDPMPALATSWTVSDDARSVTFKLRDGVKWHDGTPFTSADVKYTFEEILKKHHPRGRATFANLESVETPDKLTAVFKLSKPSAYMMAALSASNRRSCPSTCTTRATRPPARSSPRRWHRAVQVRRVAARQVHPPGQEPRLLGQGPAPLRRHDRPLHPRRRRPRGRARDRRARRQRRRSGAARRPEAHRRAAQPGGHDRGLLDVFGAMYYLEFNMRDPQFKDVRVRQAIAHAIDRDFVAKNTWFGYATPATGPISNKQPKFYTDNVPKYPFNTKRAEELLDQAGFPRQAGGIRFKISHDPASGSEEYRRFGEYFKQAMKTIGIDVELRVSDSATYQRRVWTDNAYQTTSYGIFTMPDPTIGVQRVFWSKNISKGVPYSNGSGYTSAEMDTLLEAAQVERDPTKRRDTVAQDADGGDDRPADHPDHQPLAHQRLQQAARPFHRGRRGRVRHLRQRLPGTEVRRERRRMGRYLLRRFSQALLVLVLIACTNFLIINAAPGDMVDVMAGESGAADAAYLAALRQKFSLDQPLPVRLGRYLGALATLDLGHSFRHNESVVQLILSRFPATLLLMFSALGIALVGGVVLGVAAARRPGSLRDSVISVVALLGYSTPLFWFGLMLTVLMSVKLGLLPSSGMSTIGEDFGLLGNAIDVAKHLLMPAVTLGALLHLHLYPPDARLDARDLGHGLRAHRQGEGPERAPGRLPARAAQRDPAAGHPVRRAARRGARRLGRGRGRVRLARPRHPRLRRRCSSATTTC